MELKAHDILKLKDVGSLTDKTGSAPDWLKQSLTGAPYVVVRRGIISDEYIPVGVRGYHRGERMATWISSNDFSEVLTPSDLVITALTSGILKEETKSILQLVQDCFSSELIGWGIGGSIGFSLASGICYYNEDSDLDLLLYPQYRFSHGQAQRMLTVLNQIAPQKTDVQVQCEKGGFSLYDYAKNTKVLLKTDLGPLLCDRNNIL